MLQEPSITQPVNLPQTPEQACETLRKESSRIGQLIFKNINRTPGAALHIEHALKQPWNQSTAQMAATILIHAFTQSKPPTFTNATRITKRWEKTIRKSKDKNPDRVMPLALAILESLNHGAGTILTQAAEVTPMIEPHIRQGHDVSGTVLQETVSNRKQLANYHTKHTMAAFQAHLSIPNAHDLRSLAGKRATLRIADPACGSGILLQSAANTVRLRLQQEEETAPAPPRRTLGQKDLSITLSGLDILPASVAIAHSNLHQSADPRFTTNIIRLQYGPMNKIPETGQPETGESSTDQREVGLGSIDLLEPGSLQATYVLSQDKHLKHGDQHIVIMNPPYTKLVSHTSMDQNPYHQPPKDQHGLEPTPTPTTPAEINRMNERASNIAKQFTNRTAASLANQFATLAQQLVVPGGTIASALPATALSSPPVRRGTSPSGWHLFRQNIARNFTDVTIISPVGYDVSSTSLSHDTNIAEILLIARKTFPKETPNPTARFINLTEVPKDEEEASSFAAAIRDNPSQEPSLGQTAHGTSHRSPRPDISARK